MLLLTAQVFQKRHLGEWVPNIHDMWLNMEA